MHACKWISVGLVVVMGLAACSSSDGRAPLASLPTRTPGASAVTPAGTGGPVTSLVRATGDFLTAVEQVALLDQGITFVDALSRAGAPCFGTTLNDVDKFDILFDVSGFSFPMTDFSAWRRAQDALPDAALIEQGRDALEAAAAVLPAGGDVHVCVIAVPAVPVPDAVDAQAGDAVPLAIATQPLKVIPVSADTLLLACSQGEACLDNVPALVAHGYAMAYQLRALDRPLSELTLLERIVLEGRATAFARRVVPGAVFPWDDALTPAQVPAAWQIAASRLTWRENIDRFGDRMVWSTALDETYPAWSGVWFGDQIVQGYVARHPGVSLADLLLLAPATVYDGSGYQPGA
ncbi:DUF2268 domain-containing putative Zn-dependent protease [Aggregatilinea lenta]|uniref:DUF2268 domain-containing putative Zn-dependent protease n=1 Tax=Aggregatilinea lenta TaxID=913108 RepID=UPI000E5BE680|nr:DUF2268 domain-containing putative Zn-dependent protease [Aggregatilinea lenta]